MNQNLARRVARLEAAAGAASPLLVMVRRLCAPTEPDERFEDRARAEFAAALTRADCPRVLVVSQL